MAWPADHYFDCAKFEETYTSLPLWKATCREFPCSLVVTDMHLEPQLTLQMEFAALDLISTSTKNRAAAQTHVWLQMHINTKHTSLYIFRQPFCQQQAVHKNETANTGTPKLLLAELVT
jgi:hypothetical protein